MGQGEEIVGQPRPQEGCLGILVAGRSQHAIRKDLDSDDNSHGDEEDTEGSDKEDEYLVEYVGYSPIWLPAHQVCPDAIKNWKGARVPAGGLRPLPGTGNMA